MKHKLRAMNRLRFAAARIAAMFRGRELDERIDEELRFHVEMQTQENVRRGMSPEEARRWALENEVEVIAPPTGVDIRKLPASGGSELGRAALAAAIGQMKAGAREIGANNSGRFVEKYLAGIVDTPANWCAGFCCAAAITSPCWCAKAVTATTQSSGSPCCSIHWGSGTGISAPG